MCHDKTLGDTERKKEEFRVRMNRLAVALGLPEDPLEGFSISLLEERRPGMDELPPGD